MRGIDPLLYPFILILSPSKDKDSHICLTAAFPAQAGIQIMDSCLRVRIWVPACAGNTEVVEGKQGPLRPFGPLPPKGEELKDANLPPLGEVPAKPGKGVLTLLYSP